LGEERAILLEVGLGVRGMDKKDLGMMEREQLTV
jgi:hypothetical protein